MKKIQPLCFVFAGLLISPYSLAEPPSEMARLFIELPDNDSSVKNLKKQVFHLEGYKTLECPLKKKLNKTHPDYLGELFHIESERFSANKKKIDISTKHPLMLSAIFSSIYDSDKSEICYFQSHSFWPKSNNNYLIKFNANCTVSGFKIEKSGKKQPIKLNNLVDSCFNN